VSTTQKPRTPAQTVEELVRTNNEYDMAANHALIDPAVGLGMHRLVEASSLPIPKSSVAADHRESVGARRAPSKTA
jgi:hypothetical protein